MPLNLSTDSGEFTPYLKFNSKAGRWYVRDEAGNDVEVEKPRFAIDFEHIRTGWICFPVGSPPLCVWDVQGMRAPKPEQLGSDKWKDGFEVLVYGTEPQAGLGGKPIELRQWMSNANAAKAGITEAYKQYEDGKAQNPGRVPVFMNTHVAAVNSPNGTNYEPCFALEQWVERDRIPAFDQALAERHASQPHNGAPPIPGSVGPLDPQAPHDLDDDIPF